ncbi:YwbE family protein [Paenibacillus lentus]|uniref:YwbE family protein n=1 Tax=Paenibacillus lentus TaxID=1338368 RepID=UPI0036503AD2
MSGTIRSNIKQGLTVDIVLKKDQATGRLTRGIVKDILTNSANHPHGIKVRLQDGQVGRVKAVITNSDGET